jgi:hypothetical protein
MEKILSKVTAPPLVDILEVSGTMHEDDGRPILFARIG